MRIEVPFHRFAWIAACLWLPAALGGWGRLFTAQADALFGMGYLFAFLICMILVPLSWSDHVGPEIGKGLLGVILMGIAVVAAYLGLVALDLKTLFWPLLAALVYVVPVMVVALANPEGVTLFMLLVHAFVAGGLAEGGAQHHHLALGLVVPVLTFTLGLGCSLMRRAARS